MTHEELRVAERYEQLGYCVVVLVDATREAFAFVAAYLAAGPRARVMADEQASL